MSTVDLLTQTSIRNYRTGDRFPPDLRVGFDLLGHLDGNWIWVIEEAGRIRGTLVAAPCHGVAIIYKLALMKGTRFALLAALLRRFLADMRARGVPGFFTMLDPANPVQAKLKRVIERAGGQQVGPLHAVMAAKLPRENI